MVAGTSPKVAALFARLDENRVKRGETRKDIAVSMGVSESVLSKRLNDIETPLDDDWVIRIGQYLELRTEELEELLVQAHVERASHNEATRRLWSGIHDRLLRPRATVSEAVSSAAIVTEALDSLGYTISQEDIGRILERCLPETHISMVSLDQIAGLGDELIKLLRRDPEFHAPLSAGHLFNEIWHFSNIRRFSPPKGFGIPTTAFTAVLDSRLQGAKLKSLPVLPGLMAHVIISNAGWKSIEHSHYGIEFTMPLEGEVDVIFDNQMKTSLDAKKHDMILYNARIRHYASTQRRALLFIVHFDSKLIRKWDVVLQHFVRQAPQRRRNR